jgi:hypothetical protein
MMALPRRDKSLLRRKTRRLGALSLEYMLILALIVIPIGMLLPLMMHMIVTYAGRFIWVIRSPFG